MAAEAVGLTIVSKITELLVQPALRQIRHVFCFNNFLQEFREQKENLISVQHRIQNAVSHAERNAEEIEEDVKGWLRDAVAGMEHAEHLEKRVGHITSCCTWCLNWIRQYNLSKQMEEIAERLKKSAAKGREFQILSHKAPIKDIEFLPSADFTSSESSKGAFEQILKALKNENANMVGLYGMGGVGKTTLVKEVGRRAKELKLFDEVVMVVVSQAPDVSKIQNHMADILGLRFEESSVEGRASRLWQRLANGKKMLIILDDVWKYLDLKHVGIPCGIDHNGCKVLLTTRLQQTCSSMKCQQKILLKVLSEHEAWVLFKVNAGVSDEDSTLKEVAMEVAKECQGLPIALVTVGRALREKSAVEWEVAFQQLKNSQLLHMEHIDEEKNAYACLKLSYDYLKRKETKLCFLLCSLFPEDYEIPIEHLTRYAVGFGMYQDVQSVEDVRKQVRVAIENLKDCCLLLDVDSEEHVRMHDMVRDVAIQIASQEHGFMVKAGLGLKEWPRNFESFEDCIAISLMGNDIMMFPDELVCPHLRILIMGGENLNVPDKFFEGIEAIEVLTLRGVSLSLQSLEFLTKLRCLQLIGCECKDLASLRKLRRLEILSFHKSSIKELPDEMGELKKLRLLDLTKCCQLTDIPANLIGRLEYLEELYIGDFSFKQWDTAGTSTQRMNASLAELSLLSHLAALSLNIARIECIPRDFVFPKLHKYVITMGESSSYGTSNKLELSLSMDTSKTFKHLLANVRQLHLNFAFGFENIIPAIYEGCFEDLIVLKLCRYCGIEYLIDATQQQQVPATAFSRLRELYVESVGLKEICNGQPPKGFLQKLQKVEVSCETISTLFPTKLWQALQNLMQLKVKSCSGMQEIFELDGVDGANNMLLSGLRTLTLESLHKLKCICKGPTQKVSLQSLVHLKIHFCERLSFIFTPSLAQSLLQLETLDIGYCCELEYIIRENEGEEEEEIISESLCLPKLTAILIRACHRLEYVFPVSVAPSLQRLQKLQIDEASQLTQIFGNGEDVPSLDEVGDSIVVFPQLRELILVYVPNFSNFLPKNFTAELPSLQQLKIGGLKKLDKFWAQLKGLTNLEKLVTGHCEEEHDLRCIWSCPSLKNLTTLWVIYCSRLRFIFPTSIIPSLVQLKFLKIECCNELEEIIARDSDGNDPQSLCFPNLREIDVEFCDKLKSLFPVTIAAGFLQLQGLQVRNAPQLTEVFGQDDKAASINVEKEIVLPDLRWLTLKRLPVLARFSPAFYAFKFPCLNSLKVGNCPEMATKFSATPNGSMSAQSEALRLDEDLGNGCSMPTSLYRERTPQGGWEGGKDDEPWWVTCNSQFKYDLFEAEWHDKYKIRTYI